MGFAPPAAGGCCLFGARGRRAALLCARVYALD
jgi:hypothetical protein